MADQRGNIAQFNSPIDEIHPSEIGVDALAQAGRRIGATYNQIGQDYKGAIDNVAGPAAKIVDQHDAMQDISEGAHALAAGTTNLQTQWNQFVQKSDPNDKSIQGTFLDNNLEPFLDQFQNGFTTDKGKEWALTQADRLRDHFTTTTNADMSTRAGDAVIQNSVGQMNQLKNGAYKDPQSTDIALQQVDAYYDAAKEHNSGLLSAKQLTTVDVAKQDAKNEIVKNAIKGYADSDDPKGPDKARAILNSGAYDKYIPGEEQATLNKYIDNQDSARQVETQQKQQASAAQQVKQNSQEVSGIFQSVASGQGYPATVAYGNQKLSTQQKNDFVSKDGILSLPHEFLTSPAYGDNFGSVAKSIYGGQPITAEGLTAGVRRQEITPAGAIQLQAISDKMKTADGLAEVNAQKQVLVTMQSQIVKGGPNANDPAGQKIYNNMLNSFYPAWDAAIKAGKSPAQLADPDSNDYIGNIANGFKRTDAQALADVTKATPPAAASPQKLTLPPMDKRVEGQTYPTARGDMVWTKDGWLPPKAKE